MPRKKNFSLNTSVGSRYREVDAPFTAVLYRKTNIAMILLRHERTDY